MPRGYRSATEYRFSKEQTDAIVRTTAYHRKDYCLSVIWFSPREHVDIRPSIAIPFQRTSNVGLGSLDQVPLELLYNTLFYLDIHSLFKFRQINLRSRQTLDSLKQYRMVVSHELNPLCALLRTRLAISISLFDFYSALCTKACALCSEFGVFISLLTWKRCCCKCLQSAPETQVQTLAAVRKQFHLTKIELDQLKTFKALTRIYLMRESVHKSRIEIVSVHQAILVCRRQPHALAQAQPASSEKKIKSSTLWGRVHFLITINEQEELNTEYRVPGVNLLSKKTSSALGARNGHLRLETKYMREMVFWNIFDGVNKHSSCGDRVVKVTTGQPSYRRLLGEEATSTRENDMDVKYVRQCIAARSLTGV